jgi:hypothetical protein
MTRIATSTAHHDDEGVALRQAYARLRDELGGAPSWTMIGWSASYDPTKLQGVWEGGALHGLTSSMGTMTQAGAHMGEGLSLFGIRDEEGAYGVGAAEIGDDAEAAAQDALVRALEDAERHGQLPSLLWVSCSPGHEESVISGLEEMVGEGVVITGGSAADDAIEGKWRLLDGRSCFGDGVVVTAMFPSFRHAALFQSGFQPTPHSGEVTSAEGRLLREIDGRPAAEVYDEWTGGAISAQRDAGNGRILGETSLHPLGRVVGEIQGTHHYALSHPASVEPGGALSLFTDVGVGERLCLMEGSVDRVVARAGHIIEQTRRLHDVASEQLLGALVIYCAGCMMTVPDRLDEVVEGVNASLEGAPFLGAFTFGEQGRFLGGQNRHGNLMVAALLMYEAAE